MNAGHVLGRFISSGQPLRDFAAGTEINTDDNALLEFSAPKTIDIHAADLITADLIPHLRSPFDEIVARPESEPLHWEIQETVANLLSARTMLDEAWLACERQESTCFSLLLEAYRLDPTSVFIFKMIMDQQTTLRD